MTIFGVIVLLLLVWLAFKVAGVFFKVLLWLLVIGGAIWLSPLFGGG